MFNLKKKKHVNAYKQLQRIQATSNKTIAINVIKKS
jgi:hypothetical protein